MMSDESSNNNLVPSLSHFLLDWLAAANLTLLQEERNNAGGKSEFNLRRQPGLSVEANNLFICLHRQFPEAAIAQLPSDVSTFLIKLIHPSFLNHSAATSIIINPPYTTTPLHHFGPCLCSSFLQYLASDILQPPASGTAGGEISYKSIVRTPLPSNHRL